MGLVVYGIGLGATMVSSFVLALEDAIGHGFSDNVQTYGVVSAIWSSFFALGSFIGPSVGGVLVDLGGFRWASVFVLSSQLVVLVLFSGLMMTTRECGVHDRFSQNLTMSDTTPLLGQEDPCCSKSLAHGSFDSSTDFSGKYYGTNDPLLPKSLSSSSS
jgi:MFS family permease